MHGRTILLFASLAMPIFAAPTPSTSVDHFDASIVEPRSGLSLRDLVHSVVPRVFLFHIGSRGAESETAPDIEDTVEEVQSNDISEGDAEDIHERGFVNKPGSNGKRGFVNKPGSNGKRGFVNKPGSNSKRGFVNKPGSNGKRGFVKDSGSRGK